MLFSQRLKDLRKQRNLSQKEFSDVLGISPVTLSHYENKKREPDLERLFSLCKRLKVSADYLLGLSDTETQLAQKESSISSLLDSSIPRDPLSDLDPDLRSKAEGYIDGLREAQASREATSQQEA